MTQITTKAKAFGHTLSVLDALSPSEVNLVSPDRAVMCKLPREHFTFLEAGMTVTVFIACVAVVLEPDEQPIIEMPKLILP